MLSEAVRASVGLVRIGAGVGVRVAAWSAATSTRLAARVLAASRDGETAGEVLQDTVADLRAQARELLGLRDPPRSSPAGASGRVRRTDEASLREQGAELLRRSVDLDYQEPFHPAYARVLDLLAPDEARILRLLYVDGPAPSVDVRSTSLGSKSELLEPGINVIGDQAGCRFPDRVPAYLNNLHRLGLIWFSREALDAGRYQMLEAQPRVQQALKQAKRTRTIRRSIELTPFGTDFCAVCLPTEDGA